MADRSRYFKHSNEEGILGRGFCYCEFAPFGDELVAMRQVETDAQTFLSSNLPSQICGLCDQPLTAVGPDLAVNEIGREEFEETWNRALSATTQLWREFKATHPVGTLLAAKAFGFYPHGVLADIGEAFYGVFDDAAYRDQVGELGHRIETSIIGFDDLYRWVILELVAK